MPAADLNYKAAMRPRTWRPCLHRRDRDFVAGTAVASSWIIMHIQGTKRKEEQCSTAWWPPSIPWLGSWRMTRSADCMGVLSVRGKAGGSARPGGARLPGNLHAEADSAGALPWGSGAAHGAAQVNKNLQQPTCTRCVHDQAARAVLTAAAGDLLNQVMADLPSCPCPTSVECSRVQYMQLPGMGRPDCLVTWLGCLCVQGNSST